MSSANSSQAGLGLSHGMEWAGGIGGLVREGQGFSNCPGVRDPRDHEDTVPLGTPKAAILAKAHLTPLLPVPIFLKIIF